MSKFSLAWENIEVFVGAKGPAKKKAPPKKKAAAARDEQMYTELEAPLVQEETDSSKLKKAVERTSGKLETGEMLALMGPSGAGKTTLISVLGHRPQLGQDGYWTGKVLVNGKVPTGRWRRQIAFVMQRDIFFDSLTVREELRFALRLKGSMKDFDERMKSVVRDLGLDKVLDSKIGSSVERGLSGGEVKRLNIAVELFLSDAAICLLDEPLTGLDSSRAYSVLKALRDRCSPDAPIPQGVLLSVHQPSSKIWALFDRLLLLAPKGRVVYDGLAKNASDYFYSIGKPVPPEWNPPDHFIEVITEDSDDQDTRKELVDIDQLVRTWKDAGSRSFASDDDTVESGLTGVPPPPVPQLASTGTQVLALTRRGFATAKGAALKPTRWLSVCTLALLYGALWWSVGRSKSHRGMHADDVVSIVYFFVAQWAWGPSFQTVGSFPAERDVLTKELASEVYSIESYFIAKQISEIPISLVLPAAFYIVVFPLVGLPAGSIPATYAITILMSWVSTSLGVCLSALIFDAEMTATVLIIVNIFQSCCGGFFIDMTRQPNAISWVQYASYWYYATGLYLKVVALPYDDHDMDLHYEIKDYSFSRLTIAQDIGVLIAYGLALRFAAYLALKYSPKLRFA